jgi:bacillithiol system protein YtxJ
VTGPHDLLQLRSVADFERALEESARRPLLIFKNSFTCGTSAAAFDELVDHMARSPADVRYAMVTVQTERAVSNAIAQRLGVRHETPQVLLVHNGRVEWSASHFRVNAVSLAQALSRLPAPPPTPTTTPTES